MAYWHWAAMKYGRPVMHDGTLIEIGRRYEIKREPQLCVRGYHGSTCILDALQYAPGPWVSLREIEGVVDGGDKVVGRVCTHLAGVDATDILREFARRCALEAIDNWDAPFVMRRYLETGDESIRKVARDAAWIVAHTPAQKFAWIAAQDAAWSDEWGDAWGDAWAAARDSAWAVAQNDSWNVSWAAARDAAWVAARDAAWAKYNKWLTDMVNEGMKATKVK